MHNVKQRTRSFNDLPLWRAARERQLRELPYPAKRLVRVFAFEPETAELVAELADLKGGRN